MGYIHGEIVEKDRIAWEVFNRFLESSEYDIIKTPERSRFFNFAIKSFLFTTKKYTFKKNIKIYRFFRKRFFFRHVLLKNKLFFRACNNLNIAGNISYTSCNFFWVISNCFKF